MQIYKKNKSLDNRDIGKNNIVSKRGLSKSDIIDYDIYDVSKVMETLIKNLNIDMKELKLLQKRIKDSWRNLIIQQAIIMAYAEAMMKSQTY